MAKSCGRSGRSEGRPRLQQPLLPPATRESWRDGVAAGEVSKPLERLGATQPRVRKLGGGGRAVVQRPHGPAPSLQPATLSVRSGPCDGPIRSR